jgi:hypothetical protein
MKGRNRMKCVDQLLARLPSASKDSGSNFGIPRKEYKKTVLKKTKKCESVNLEGN